MIIKSLKRGFNRWWTSLINAVTDMSNDQFQRSNGYFWSQPLPAGVRESKKALPMLTRDIGACDLFCPGCNNAWKVEGYVAHTRGPVYFLRRKNSIVKCPSCGNIHKLEITKYYSKKELSNEPK